jgi:hypothetical protein
MRIYIFGYSKYKFYYKFSNCKQNIVLHIYYVMDINFTIINNRFVNELEVKPHNVKFSRQ